MDGMLKRNQSPKSWKYENTEKQSVFIPSSEVTEDSAGTLNLLLPPDRFFFYRSNLFTTNSKGLYWASLEISELHLGLFNRLYRLFQSLIEQAVTDIKKYLSK